MKRAQRRVARRKKGSRKKGSTRRRKAVVLLATAPQRVRRQRQDFHDKSARCLVREHDTISQEDVPTAHLLRNHHLAKRIQDAGWSAFLSILPSTAAGAGRRVVAVPPADPSQRCAGGGELVPQGWSVRWHRCPEWGRSLQRDHTAARTRERAGQARRGGVAGAASENRASAGL